MSKVLLANKASYKFDDTLSLVIDNVLLQVFNQEGAKVIYDFLEQNYHLKLTDIADKPEVFSEGLRNLMATAAPVVEKLILQQLHNKFGVKFEKKKDDKFSDCLKNLKVHISD